MVCQNHPAPTLSLHNTAPWCVMSRQGVGLGWPLHPSLPHFLYTSSLSRFFFFFSPRATFFIIFLCGQAPNKIPLWSSGTEWLQLIPNIINESLFCLIRCHEADEAYTRMQVQPLRTLSTITNGHPQTTSHLPTLSRSFSVSLTRLVNDGWWASLPL